MRVVLSILFLMSCFPAGASAQGRWRAALLETGLGIGPQGGSVALGVNAEVGVSNDLRAIVRWSRRAGAVCGEDGGCPRESDVIEIGPGIRLGAGDRAVSFANLLLGVHWEEEAFSAGTNAYASASVSFGLDLRLFPPVTLRLALRHQEVPGSQTNRWPKATARNTGLVVGLGVTSW